jgi:ABC-type methionine transport system ATPase subunit
MIDVRVKLTFPEELVRQPFIARLAREHGVEPNIRRANVDEHEGWIVCELEGEPDKVDGALAWLRDQGVRVDLLGDVVES